MLSSTIKPINQGQTAINHAQKTDIWKQNDDGLIYIRNCNCSRQQNRMLTYECNFSWGRSQLVGLR